jgi:glycosyltransferase involved in cell wall biosynthesis
MPRIAYLYSRYPVVSQTFCDSEMLALESMGFDLQIVSLNAPPDSFRHERLDRLKAEIHYPPPQDILDAKAAAPEFMEKLGPLIAEHDAKYGKSFKALTRARNAWHFAPLLRKLGVTHIHVHFANRATHTALFLKELGFTFSFTAHAQDFMVDLGSDDLLREMITAAEFTIAVSDFSRDLLVNISPASASKIIRIYNGIELDDFAPAKPEAGGRLRIVSIGRLIEFKGFHWLISAVALLKQQGLDVEVRIIGDGPWRGDLEAQILNEGVGDQVHLLGVRSQEQIKRELAAAQLFVLPSIVDRKGASDILPTVITEAMACRLPVVSTTVAGIPEMVVHGQTGLLVEPGDAAGLAKAISELASDPEKRKLLGEAGRKRSEELFALSVTAGQLGGHFSDIPLPKVTPTCIEPSVVYWMNNWNGSPTHLESLADEPHLRVLAGGFTGDASKAGSVALGQVEFLPDAAVLESLWLRHSGQRLRLERLRSRIGEAVTGEEFYLQARRAVYLADVLPRRGVKHVHAFRSDAILCVWLLRNLVPIGTSAAVEEGPVLSRALLAKLLPDFDVASVSDKKLGSLSAGDKSDHLNLTNPPTHRELSLGPFRIKTKANTVAVDRCSLEHKWFQLLLARHHV